MAEIVRLSEYRQRSVVQAGFKLWRRCFKEDFSAQTRLNDLGPSVLCRLAEPAEASAIYYYSLIIGLLGHGEDVSFENLDNRTQIQLVDIHLFLADQIRFEMMRRLGWLARFCATQYHIVDMVLKFDHIRALCSQDPPSLARSHPAYQAYKGLIPQDQQVFIRRMLPSVFDEFRRTYSI